MYTDVSVVGLLAAEKLTTAGLQVDCIMYTDLSVVGLLAVEKLPTAGHQVKNIE